jgi:hypothetical protein
MSFPGGGSIGREGHCSFNAYLPATTLNTRGDLPVRSIAVAALAVMFSMVLLAGCGSNVGKYEEPADVKPSTFDPVKNKSVLEAPPVIKK